MRTRLIRPGFFSNEDLGELPAEARILFIGLWCMADREGRLELRPRRICAEVFPYGAKQDICELLDSLTARKLILCYSAAGHAYIQVLNFSKHQSPNRNENSSNIPEPSEECDFIGSSCTALHMHSCSVTKQVNKKTSKQVLPEEEREEEGRETKTISKIELAPRISLTPEEKAALDAEFGAAGVAYTAVLASDWLLANGKMKKSAAAFLRNWIRRDLAERRNFWHPSRTGETKKEFLTAYEKKIAVEERALERARQMDISGRGLFGSPTPLGLEDKRK